MNNSRSSRVKIKSRYSDIEDIVIGFAMGLLVVNLFQGNPLLTWATGFLLLVNGYFSREDKKLWVSVILGIGMIVSAFAFILIAVVDLGILPTS